MGAPAAPAQQLDLRLDRHLAELVEEDGAAVGQLEAPDAALGGSGERTLSCPNSSLSMSPVGTRRSSP
jgi:hypothetical protein